MTRTHDTGAQLEALAGRLFWPVAILQVALVCVLPLLRGDAPASILNHYWDDFFYYLQIARNIATEFRSTFDGTSLTNGYHPLWMSVLVGLCLLFDPTTLSFHLALAAVIGAASLLTAAGAYFVARQAFDLVPVAAASLALIAQGYHLHLSYTGMEIGLAIPLMLGVAMAGHRFVRQPSGRHAVLWAGTASLCILSRLDTALYVALVAGLVLCVTPRKEVRAWLRAPIVTGVIAGSLPLVLYGALNLVVFATLTPVSAQAKQLAPFPVWNAKPLLFVLSGPVMKAAVPAIIVVSALASWVRIRPVEPYWRAAIAGMMIFPAVHLITIASVSDWILWPWYFYPLTLAVVAALTAFARSMNKQIVAGIAAALLAGLYAETAISDWSERHWEPGITESSLAIAGFAAKNAGTFAMGDRAGRVGFLMPNRVVQLEGLVNSRDFLDRIRRADDLRQVLGALNVRYYIGTAMARRDACYLGTEPKVEQAGDTSPRMIGAFCDPPVFAHVDSRGVQTLIFEIAPRGG